jgi:signal transduction histidine kinase/CheY-like chemotaxis protein/HPt (histidine-containing phosphotransfer) domain-containing protein
MSTQGRASLPATLTALAAACSAGAAGLAWAMDSSLWLPISAVAATGAIGTALWAGTNARNAEQELLRLQDRTDTSEIETRRLQTQLKRHGELDQQLLQAKQAAESATLAKGEFLATMSHEIRTPLNGIIPMLEMLSQGPLNNQQREMLQTARESSMQLFRIVDDILDYSKLEASRLELEVTTFNLREVLGSMLQLLQHSAQNKQLKVSLTIDPSVRLAVRGDPVRLRQVLSNLIVNAVKFTEHGSVDLHVSRRGEDAEHHQLRFEVRDTGIGISKEQQQRLFNSFTQADASTTRLYGGTGLGLAICKRIVDLMKGTIGVESEQRRGSTFWFEIPLLKVAGDINSRMQLPPPSQILLVSNDSVLRHRMELQLSNRNIAVHLSDNVPEALERLRAVTTASTQVPLTMVFADLDIVGDAATALHRAVTRTHAPQGLRLVWLQGERHIPEDLLSRADVMQRHFQESELLAAIQPRSAPEPAIGDDLQSASYSAAATPPPAPNVSLIGANVLLVEDNPVNQIVAQKLLGVLGCNTGNASNGEQALQEMATGRYDLVLMDCQMPVLDGYAATRQWREREFATGAARLPIIAMTANAMAGDRQRCLDAGMDDYLSKPVSRDELRTCLQRWYQGASPSRSYPAPRSADAPSLGAGTPESSATATQSTALPVLDFELLDELLEIAGPETARIIALFLNDTPGMIRQLQEAALAADMEQLREVAHSLKSSSANLGAGALSAAARRVELGARAETLEHPAVAVALIIAEFARARIALAGYKAKLNSIVDEPAE